MGTLNGTSHVVPMLYGDENLLIIAMPAADGNLYEYIQRHNIILKLPDRVKLFEHVLVAMTTAHVRNILHRDLAPPNVLTFMEPAGVVAKVADFGLGKRLDSGSVLTKPEDNHYGRTLYTAPEVLESLSNASKQSDVYSMGVVLKFILNGKSPNRKYEGPFAAIVRRATEEEPVNRYADAIAMQKAFEDMKNVVLAPTDAPKTVVEILGEKIRSTGKCFTTLPRRSTLARILKFS
jgi:eukaryotic-like serine/threonine-protein kinase